jgi:hypothetical protein
MRAELLKLRCLSIFTVLPVLLLMSLDVMAQTGGVQLTGRVSETVTLSVLPNFSSDNANAEVIRNGNTVRIVLSGDGSDAVYRVPLLVRSNSRFKISGEVESSSATELAELSVVDVSRTGTLASPLTLSDLSVRAQNENNPNTVAFSQPSLVVTGPRISLGGTLDSPSNALQMTVLIRVRPHQAQRWLVHLTFSATAVSLTQ